MIYYPNTQHDPTLNLAAEEYLLTHGSFGEPILFFYVNDPSIIIGRHQIAADEINSEFVHERNIKIVRRCSGGGAVYHDRGNLNYSLIFPGEKHANRDFSVLLDPVLDAMRSLGVPAERSGRNDLLADGKKFSGNAYYISKYGSVIHGTLLFDTDLSVLGQALKPNPEKLRSKGIASVRSRVCNLKEFLPDVHSVDDLENAIADRFSSDRALITRNFNENDLVQIEKLADSRYRNDAWTYGKASFYNFRFTFQRPYGTVDIQANISGGKIAGIRFSGDFFCTGDISGLEAGLSGIPLDEEKLSAAFADSGWDIFFPDDSFEPLMRELLSMKADG